MGCSYRLASRRKGICAAASSSARGCAAATSSAAATACRTDTTAGESTAHVQRSDPGESADASAWTVDEPHLARHRSRWRRHCLHLECAGWNVQPANGDKYDMDRAEPGRQLSAHRYGERRTRRYGY